MGTAFYTFFKHCYVVPICDPFGANECFFEVLTVVVCNYLLLDYVLFVLIFFKFSWPSSGSDILRMNRALTFF